MAEGPDFTSITADIVAAYVRGSKIGPNDIPALISTVHTALAQLDQPEAEPEPEIKRATSAQVRKSISEAGLVSFEDGKIYQGLKRHLTTRGMTPAEYRAKWGLPHDYPMVAPAYSSRRSELAKSIGLGRGGGRRGRGAAIPSSEASAAKAQIAKIVKATKSPATSTKKLAPGAANPKRGSKAPM